MQGVGEMSSSKYMLIEADHPHHFEMARVLFQEYAAQLGVDLCFQDFASELNQLSHMYGAPSGRLVLVMDGTVAVGCGALRRLSVGVCEMKRLYIRSDARGASLGRRVAEHLLDSARTLGYEKMRLDTLADMAPAQSLYRSLGFHEIAPYYNNPLSNSVYMELSLTSAAIS
jgi:ribosomal protein S18 acetylase RimI-like enzyme